MLIDLVIKGFTECDGVSDQSLGGPSFQERTCRCGGGGPVGPRADDGEGCRKAQTVGHETQAPVSLGRVALERALHGGNAGSNPAGDAKPPKQ